MLINAYFPLSIWREHAQQTKLVWFAILCVVPSIFIAEVNIISMQNGEKNSAEAIPELNHFACKLLFITHLTEQNKVLTMAV